MIFVGEKRRRDRTLARTLASLLAIMSGCAMQDRAPACREAPPFVSPESTPPKSAESGVVQETLAIPSAPVAPASATVEEGGAPAELPASRPAAVEVLHGHPVTLLAVLEVADAENPQVQVARQRIEEAYAAWERAETLWLPSIRAGMNFNRHEGRIQDVIGFNIDTSRGSFGAGLGTQAVGAGSPAIPGVYANFHLADAVFQPRITSEVAAAREANADAVRNEALFQAAQAYFELLRAAQERALAAQVRDLARRLADLTKSYAQTGEGLAADDDRAQTEWNLRESELLRAEEAERTASARLAQQLRLDPTTPLLPQEPALTEIHLFQGDEPIASLVARGLSSRPEVREHQALVNEAVDRLTRERVGPLLPSVLLGVSQTAFGAGINGDVGRVADRFDADAVVWWEVRNLGAGERAARRESKARLEQARWREVALLDQIAREIVESHGQVESRRRQLVVARRAVECARKSYDRNVDRIQNGQGLPLEALQSLQARAAAEREYVRVLFDYDVAQFALQRALGDSQLAHEDESTTGAAE